MKIKSLLLQILLIAFVFSVGTTTQADVSGKIIGGTIAPVNKYPSTVAILFKDNFDLIVNGNTSAADPVDAHFQSQFCAGTLIDPEWVLTAAHCMIDFVPGELLVLEGTQSLVITDNDGNTSNAIPESALPGNRITVTHIIRHPDYDVNSFDSDLALLKLSAPATQPVSSIFIGSLAASSIAASATSCTNANNCASIVGWGTDDAVNGNTFPTDLLEAEVPLVTNASCNTDLGGGITSNMLCAGFAQGGRDTCQGDSGGPLFMSASGSPNAGDYEIAGITSFGNGCANSESPGVYTNVVVFQNFIDGFLNGTVATTDAPFITTTQTNYSVSVSQNLPVFITTLTATDGDNDILSWSVEDGNRPGDANFFAIDANGNLTLTSVPGSINNNYELLVKVTDNQDGSDFIRININLNNTQPDNDNDGTPDIDDADDDNDGVDDIDDAFPFDDTETADSDGDGIGDNADPTPNGETSGQLVQFTPVAAVASSFENTSFFVLPPENAVDADTDTRWSSEFTDNEWIYVDLGGEHIIDRVYLDWETAFGKKYELQISDDAQNWTTIFTQTNGDGSLDEINFPQATARYVRMLGVERGTQWGYSLYEIVVRGRLNNQAPDNDGDGIPDSIDADDDNDGVDDIDDAFPFDPRESIDTDDDGTGNNADTDDDGDGVNDLLDVFPLDASESGDADADGIGDNSDSEFNQPTRITNLISNESGELAVNAAAIGTIGTTVSDDGRFTVYESNSPLLVSNDTNESSDVFIYDRITQQTELVSVNTTGMQGNDDSFDAAISADGRFVVFTSQATNLMESVGNTVSGSVYLRDRLTGITELIAEQANTATISADGNVIVFSSRSNELVSNDENNNIDDVFAYDRSSTTTTLVSVSSNGVQADQDSFFPSVSPDGRFVIFSAAATTLSTMVTEPSQQIYIRDLLLQTTELITLGSDGEVGNSGSHGYGFISANNEYVVFTAESGNLALVDGLSTGPSIGLQVFVYTRATGEFEFVSTLPDGQRNSGNNLATAISADGRYVLFDSAAEGSQRWDSYVYDRVIQRAILVNVAENGEISDQGTSTLASGMDASGTFIAFTSNATNIDSTHTVVGTVIGTNVYLQNRVVAGDDLDGDLIANGFDLDDDNDGVDDVDDAFPLDASESQDSDGDGIGDNTDPTPNGENNGSSVLLTPVAAVASSFENTSFFILPADLAIDGDMDTRWGSEFSDGQWIYLDLGARYFIDRVVLDWETAYGKQYDIQISNDSFNWEDVVSVQDGDGGIDDLSFSPRLTRYVRMQGRERATQWGFSLYEFQLFGDLTNIAPTAELFTSSTAEVGQIVTLEGIGSADPDGTIESYIYDFGDGNTAESQDVTSHTYQSVGTYTITLTVTDNDGAVGTATRTIVITAALPDFDEDGIPDVNDTDDDNDGVLDVNDAFPFDDSETTDTDGDGIGDNADPTPNGDTSGSSVLLTPVAAVASSFENTNFFVLPAANAIDSDLNTRWGSNFSANEWIYVDLGQPYDIDRVVLNWETAFASHYQIQVSHDAINWVSVIAEMNGDGGVDDINFTSESGRYVRMLGIERATPWGYSLFEFDVYGSDSNSVLPAGAAALQLNFNEKNTFNFSWTDLPDVDFYQLFETTNNLSAPTQVGDNIGPGIEAVDLIVPLHLRADANYFLMSCTTAGCVESNLVSVNSTLANSITLIEPESLDLGDWFGAPIELSADGSTLAIGSRFDDGVPGNQFSNSASNTGAVFIFTRNGSDWIQQGYLKTSIGFRGVNSRFGSTLSLTADGNTLVVGSSEEDSDATGVNGNQMNSGAIGSGAAYVFTRTAGIWSESAYIKASNTEAGDDFGARVAISANGEKIAVSAINEDSSTNGVNGNQNDNSIEKAGAVYVFGKNNGDWEQEAYLKPLSDKFNGDLAASCCDLDLDFSNDGSVLAIGAATHESMGAVYIFSNTNNTWSQNAVIKPTNLEIGDNFGQSISLSGDADLLAIGAPLSNNAKGMVSVFKRTASGWIDSFIVLNGFNNGDTFGANVELNFNGDLLFVAAPGEDSSSTGIDGNQFNNDTFSSGAVLVYGISDDQTNAEQISFVKAPLTNINDRFSSEGMAISSSGSTLAVGASLLDKSDTETNSGGVFIY